MSSLAWLVMAIVLFALEMLTPGMFFFVCFGIGALVASLMVLLGAPAWVAWAVFFTLSFLLILLAAPLARRWMKRNPATPVGLDAYGGQTGYVVDTIDPSTGRGQVRLSSGAIWLAASGQHIPEGSAVVIDRIVGTRLQVSLSSETTS
jgi:membrane protein implicated in regulation of membrane protease activity